MQLVQKKLKGLAKTIVEQEREETSWFALTDLK